MPPKALGLDELKFSIVAGLPGLGKDKIATIDGDGKIGVSPMILAKELEPKAFEQILTATNNMIAGLEEAVALGAKLPAGVASAIGLAPNAALALEIAKDFKTALEAMVVLYKIVHDSRQVASDLNQAQVELVHTSSSLAQANAALEQAKQDRTAAEEAEARAVANFETIEKANGTLILDTLTLIYHALRKTDQTKALTIMLGLLDISFQGVHINQIDARLIELNLEPAPATAGDTNSTTEGGELQDRVAEPVGASANGTAN